MDLRFRFSLRSLILAISIVVLTLSHGLSSYRLYRTQREVDAWRSDLGGLLSDGSTELQVVSVNTGRLDHWMWRVSVPPGRKYDLVLEFRELAPTQLEQSTNSTHSMSFGPDDARRILGPGETAVTFIWGQRDLGIGGSTDLNRPERFLNMVLFAMRPNQMGGNNYTEDTDRIPWMHDDWTREFSVVGDKMPVALDADSPAPLLEVRAFPIQELPNVDSTDAPKFTLKLVPTP
jgi:hypothetical protein